MMKVKYLPFLIFLNACGDHKPTQLIKDIEAIFPADKQVEKQRADRAETPPIAKSGNHLPEDNTTTKREALVAYAQKYLGKPYVYGSMDPAKGFDCSGYINFVYNHFGYTVPRSSKDFEFFGREVPVDKVQKGDLLIFNGTNYDSPEIGHIGIVLDAAGHNSSFIHSSSGAANAVTVSLLSSDHYRKRFVKAISVMD